MLQKLSKVGNICQDNLKIWPHVTPQDYAWNQSLHGSVRWENFNSVIVISLRPLDLKLSITRVRFPNHPPWFESLPKILDCCDILFFSCALTVTKRLCHFPYATVSVSILDKKLRWPLNFFISWPLWGSTTERCYEWAPVYINANSLKPILYDYCRVPNLTAYARLNRKFNIDTSKQEIVVVIAIASNSKTKLNVDH